MEIATSKRLLAKNHASVVNRTRAFRVGFGPGTGLGFKKLSGFNRAGLRSKIEIFSE